MLFALPNLISNNPVSAIHSICTGVHSAPSYISGDCLCAFKVDACTDSGLWGLSVTQLAHNHTAMSIAIALPQG